MATDAEIGDHLSMSARNVQSLRAKGVLPPPSTDLDENRAAYIAYMREAAAGRVKAPERSDLDAERARLAREQADQIALKNAAARGELVSVTAVGQAVVGMIEVAKTKLKRVPGKVAPSDPAMKDRIALAIEDALIDVSAERAIVTVDADDADDD